MQQPIQLGRIIVTPYKALTEGAKYYLEKFYFTFCETSNVNWEHTFRKLKNIIAQIKIFQCTINHKCEWRENNLNYSSNYSNLVFEYKKYSVSWKAQLTLYLQGKIVATF